MFMPTPLKLKIKTLNQESNIFLMNEEDDVVEVFWMQIFHEKVWACLDGHALKKSINYYYNV